MVVANMVTFISLMEAINFGDWLTQKLNEKHWNQSELVRRSGLTSAQISRLISGSRKPGKNACESIAKAFDISILTVYRHAGILPPGPDDDISFDDWKVILRELTDDQREELLRITEAMRELNKKREAQKRGAIQKVV